jgi:tRNA-2-methylthio-N6-dimethylallyladenosine synthase
MLIAAWPWLHGHHRDDVPEEVKHRRLKEVIDTFFATLAEKSREEVGRRHLVLVEGVHVRPAAATWRPDTLLIPFLVSAQTSRRSSNDLMGRTDNNKKVVFPNVKVDAEYSVGTTGKTAAAADSKVEVRPGDYVVVEVDNTTGLTLLGRPLARTSLSRFAQLSASS